MTSPALTAWCLAAALHFAPISRLPQYPGHEETKDEALERYQSIAQDVASAAGEVPDSKRRAALLLAIAIGESGLAHDADVGPCYRGKDKHSPLHTRCDSGLAASPYQLHPVWFEHRVVTQNELFADRALASRIVLRFALGSFGLCKDLPVEDRLSGMGLGHCERGNKSVEARFRLYTQIRDWNPTPEEKTELATRAR